MEHKTEENMRKNGILKILVLALLITVIFMPDAMAADGVFETIRNRTTKFARELRVLAYVISCFGIIMFTFLAISGKINFKHLSYIFISLCMLSATGGIVDYFSGDYPKLASSENLNDTFTAQAPSSSLGQ